MADTMTSADPDMARRQAMMSISAQAAPGELAAILADLSPLPEIRDMRPAQTGLTMLRGRAGGDGAVFNLGEATVTRSAVALPGDTAGEGQAGFAYHLGRDRAKARHAAILDALWQTPEHRPVVEAALARVGKRLAADREKRARETAATRVNFFTLARGED